MLGALFEFVRQRSGALLAPIWMHGVLNATAGSMVFVSGSDLIRGPTGAAGVLVLVAMNLALWRHLRRHERADVARDADMAPGAARLDRDAAPIARPPLGGIDASR